MIYLVTDSKEDAELRAEEMYQLALGQEIQVKEVDYMDSEEFTGVARCVANNPYIRLKVTETTTDDRSKRWIDGNLDPLWNVALVEPHPSIEEDMVALWVYNPFCFVVK